MGKRHRAPEPKTMERLQKVLATAGVCSRRAGERLIEAGRVRVNGHVVTKLGTIMTQFKVGKPQPVITFEPDRFIQDWWQSAPDKEAGQTTAVEMERQPDDRKPAAQRSDEEPPPVAEDDNTIDNWT